jgi:hypothetical protein
MFMTASTRSFLTHATRTVFVSRGIPQVATRTKHDLSQREVGNVPSRAGGFSSFESDFRKRPSDFQTRAIRESRSIACSASQRKGSPGVDVVKTSRPWMLQLSIKDTLVRVSTFKASVAKCNGWLSQVTGRLASVEPDGISRRPP